MSKKAVEAFLEDVARDPHLQKEIVDLAAKYGHDFRADELSDADLAGVSGGVDLSSVLNVLAAAKKKPAKK